MATLFTSEDDRVKAQAAARQRQLAQRQALEEQIRLKQERVAAEKRKAQALEAKAIAEHNAYNPWGRGGSGAPRVGPDGRVVTSRKQLTPRVDTTALDSGAALNVSPVRDLPGGSSSSINASGASVQSPSRGIGGHVPKASSPLASALKKATPSLGQLGRSPSGAAADYRRMNELSVMGSDAGTHKAHMDAKEARRLEFVRDLEEQVKAKKARKEKEQAEKRARELAELQEYESANPWRHNAKPSKIHAVGGSIVHGINGAGSASASPRQSGVQNSPISVPAEQGGNGSNRAVAEDTPGDAVADAQDGGGGGGGFGALAAKANNNPGGRPGVVVVDTDASDVPGLGGGVSPQNDDGHAPASARSRHSHHDQAHDDHRSEDGVRGEDRRRRPSNRSRERRRGSGRRLGGRRNSSASHDSEDASGGPGGRRGRHGSARVRGGRGRGGRANALRDQGRAGRGRVASARRANQGKDRRAALAGRAHSDRVRGTRGQQQQQEEDDRSGGGGGRVVAAGRRKGQLRGAGVGGSDRDRDRDRDSSRDRRESRRNRSSNVGAGRRRKESVDVSPLPTGRRGRGSNRRLSVQERFDVIRQEYKPANTAKDEAFKQLADLCKALMAEQSELKSALKQQQTAVSRLSDKIADAPVPSAASKRGNGSAQRPSNLSQAGASPSRQLRRIASMSSATSVSPMPSPMRRIKSTSSNIQDAPNDNAGAAGSRLPKFGRRAKEAAGGAANARSAKRGGSRAAARGARGGRRRAEDAGGGGGGGRGRGGRLAAAEPLRKPRHLDVQRGRRDRGRGRGRNRASDEGRAAPNSAREPRAGGRGRGRRRGPGKGAQRQNSGNLELLDDQHSHRLRSRLRKHERSASIEAPTDGMDRVLDEMALEPVLSGKQRRHTDGGALEESLRASSTFIYPQDEVKARALLMGMDAPVDDPEPLDSGVVGASPAAPRRHHHHHGHAPGAAPTLASITEPSGGDVQHAEEGRGGGNGAGNAPVTPARAPVPSTESRRSGASRIRVKNPFGRGANRKKRAAANDGSTRTDAPVSAAAAQPVGDEA